MLFEFNGSNQEKQTLLRYLEKNDQVYNWIVTELNKIRACIWWNGNVQFSVTPLRSFLKRLKRKIPDLEISRKMSTREGVMRVYDGNVPVLSNVNVLQRSSIFHLTKPVREHVLRLRLPEQYKWLQKSTKLNKKEPNSVNIVEKAPPPEEIDPAFHMQQEVSNKEPDSTNNIEEPTPPKVDAVSNEEFKCYKYKVNLLARVTARIVDEVKELSRLLQPVESTEPVEVIEDTSSSMITHADEDTSSSMVTHADEDTSSSMITHADEDTSSSMVTHADEDTSLNEDTPPLLITHPSSMITTDVSLYPEQPEVTEVLEKPTRKFGILKYCNRDPITGECDGDPRGHMHPF